MNWGILLKDNRKHPPGRRRSALRQKKIARIVADRPAQMIVGSAPASRHQTRRHLPSIS
ncbi:MULTISPECIES: hypothetical protein [Bacteria]|uniref:hypothetical protein n=1 Tax=Bacteria TaxID=2 RepID=UPI0014034EDD|nr:MULTISPECIES: hypothetical protein [Bacteria]